MYKRIVMFLLVAVTLVLAACGNDNKESSDGGDEDAKGLDTRILTIALAAAISLIIPETITDIIGLAIVIVIFALNIIKSRKEKVSPA